MVFVLLCVCCVCCMCVFVCFVCCACVCACCVRACVCMRVCVRVWVCGCVGLWVCGVRVSVCISGSGQTHLCASTAQAGTHSAIAANTRPGRDGVAMLFTMIT